MCAVGVAVVVALFIAFGLTKMPALVGGAFTGLAYFGISMLSVTALAARLTGPREAALMAAGLTEAIVGVVIALVACGGIAVVRRFR